MLTISWYLSIFKRRLLLNYKSNPNQTLTTNNLFNKFPPYKIFSTSIPFFKNPYFAYSPFHSPFRSTSTDFAQNLIKSIPGPNTSLPKIWSLFDASFFRNRTYIHTYIHTYTHTSVIKILLFLDVSDLGGYEKHKNFICQFFCDYHALSPYGR